MATPFKESGLVLSEWIQASRNPSKSFSHNSGNKDDRAEEQILSISLPLNLSKESHWSKRRTATDDFEAISTNRVEEFELSSSSPRSPRGRILLEPIDETLRERKSTNKKAKKPSSHKKNSREACKSPTFQLLTDTNESPRQTLKDATSTTDLKLNPSGSVGLLPPLSPGHQPLSSTSYQQRTYPASSPNSPVIPVRNSERGQGDKGIISVSSAGSLVNLIQSSDQTSGQNKGEYDGYSRGYLKIPQA